jgi:O-acetylhomoserine (thiol)-lyase
MAAIFLAIMTLCESGDHIVASSQVYGGTANLLRLTLPKFGINTTFVKPRDTEGFQKAIKENTKCIFGELLGNPGNELMNMPEVADIAHNAGIPLMIDSTYQTPYLCRPFDFGADIVIHSLTKWMAGHGSSMAGIIVEGGKFNWMQNDKFPSLTKEYEGYHGLSFC